MDYSSHHRIIYLCFQPLLKLMTDKKHEQLFILPALHNLKIFVFYVLPDGHLLPGVLQIGGNCIVFNPHPQSSTQKTVKRNYQVFGLIKLLLDNVEKFALVPNVPNMEKPTKIQVLRSLCTTVPNKTCDHLNRFFVPSYQDTKGSDATHLRYLDFGLLKQVLGSDPQKISTRLVQMCTSAKLQDYREVGLCPSQTYQMGGVNRESADSTTGFFEPVIVRHSSSTIPEKIPEEASEPLQFHKPLIDPLQYPTSLPHTNSVSCCYSHSGQASSSLKRMPTLSQLGEEIVIECPTIPSRYMMLRTFRGDHFVFLCPQTQKLHQFVNELYEFMIKHQASRRGEALIETSGSEDFDFVQLEPPKSVKKLVAKIKTTGVSQQGLFIRHGLFYRKTELKAEPGKATGMAQIQYLEKQKKRHKNKKKFEDSSLAGITFTNKQNEDTLSPINSIIGQSPANQNINNGSFVNGTDTHSKHFKVDKSEVADHYEKYGNYYNDSIIQSQWKTLFTTGQHPETEFSDSDMAIDIDVQNDCSILQKQVDSGLVRRSLNDKDGLEDLDSVILQILKKSDRQIQQTQAQIEPNTSDNQYYIGRGSEILNHKDMEQLLDFLPEKIKTFKALVQYQGQTDGMRLFILWESYNRHTDKMSFAYALSNTNDLDIQDAGQELQQAKYNFNIDFSKILFSQDQLLCVKLRSGCQIIVHFNVNPPKKSGWFGNTSTFILVKEYDQEKFRKYVPSGKNAQYLKREHNKIIIGGGSTGSALTIQGDFVSAQTQKCETFNSDYLFQGDLKINYVDQLIENVEIIRFVIAD